jgi:uncharacterized coiled-coil protein SlyX
MKTQIEQRLKELKAEFVSGQNVLAELETKQANMKNTLLRISEAIRVLEEELAKDNLIDKKDKTTSTREK